ncbi:carbohydrate binding family 9 domain-containing protein [candidate division KSB1 bacterium]|nr:carbohydrate binding family 9 domain-containing protein [candidate division KSB1 bacterium]
MIRPAAVSLLLIIAFGSVTANEPVFAQSANGTLEAIATLIHDSPVIDGVLDEPFWQTLPVIDGFKQREPNEGAEPTEKTEVRIAYDDKNLYFGMTMYDSEPSKIIRSVLKRGGWIDQDDRIIIGLDTYRDKRNSYIFEINSYGTQDDALVTDESGQNWSWDGVYMSEGNITDYGWVLEIAIPFTTIRFSKDDEPEMAVAFYRSIRRKNEEVFWPPLDRDFRGGLVQVSQYGNLIGLRDIKPGRNIQVKPYALGGAQKIASGGDGATTTGDIGIDVKYGITPNLTLDATLNTDFAQVEEDNIQINLTRFSLFFPEKRDFFLERAGLFDFGAQRSTQTFFSRRIGLRNDILAGARLTGQAGRFSLGLLNIQTDDSSEMPGANNAVVRIRTDLRPRTTVGGIFTNFQGNEGGSGFHNRVAGLDIAHRFLTRSSFNAWFSNVWSSDELNGSAAGSANLSIANDLYGFGMGYTNVGANFDPALGFVRRRNVVQYTGNTSYSPRIGGSDDLIRQLTFGMNYSRIQGQNGDLQSESFSSSNQAFLESGDRLRLNIGWNKEVLEGSFNIRPGITTIPADTYEFVDASLNLTLNRRRKLWGTASIETGKYFGGNRTVIATNTNYKFTSHFSVESSIRSTIISLPYDNGDFTTSIFSIRLLAATGRKLFGNALIQYDNVSKNFRSNIRIDWIHTPGSDLFIVFNTGYNFNDGLNFRENSLISRAGVLKLTYLFSL